MSRILNDIQIGLDEDLAEKLAYLAPNYSEYRILKQSVDARSRHNPHFVYSIEVADQDEKLPSKRIDIEKANYTGEKPIVVGTGPAGLFCALRLAERGIPCHIFERGSKAEKRIQGINRFWRYGTLDRRNNVCYGEGGAGLYSDGKLITRIKSDHIPYVLQRLVDFGAPAEIEYLSNPHVGSDKIRRVIPKLREHLLKLGCEIHFDTQVTELLTSNNNITGIKTEHGQIFNSPFVVLATGHSAEDMLIHLREIGVRLEGKSFAMGLRIEHPQKLINKIQYRDFSEHPKLGAANYKIAHHDSKANIGVYSFCMCPGGYVLSSGTEPDGVVCNGMSNFHRNSPFANAAIVISIDHGKSFGNNLWGGMELRRNLETSAFTAVQKAGGTKQLPAQKVTDFFKSRVSALDSTSSPSGVQAVNLRALLPPDMANRLEQSLNHFEKLMPGFTGELAQLYGMETRTSCPIRVSRDSETLQSLSHTGLYPAGEGAGYAGGITSAACDGVKIADSIMTLVSSRSLAKKD